MVLSASIDWSAKYTALYQWAYGVTGWSTVWADQDAPRPDYPYVLLDVISDRKEGGIAEVSRTVDLTRARDVRITPTASNNQTYQVVVNGTVFSYTSDADATVAEIVAGLVAAVGGGAEPVSATDGGTHIDLVGEGEALNPATPRTFTITTSGPIVWQNNDAGNEVETRVSEQLEFTLNLQAFVRNTRTDNAANDPSRNAYNALTTLRASLGLPSVQAALRAADIAVVEELTITDLSEAVDETILSRASMDIRMRTLSVLVEYTGFIEQVSGGSTYSGPRDSPITDTFEVDS